MRVMSPLPWVTVRGWEAGQWEMVTNDLYDSHSFTSAGRFIYSECKRKKKDIHIIYAMRFYEKLLQTPALMVMNKHVSHASATAAEM